MKNLFYMFLPLSLILALFAYLNNKDISYYGFLQGLKDIDFQLPNINNIARDFNAIKSITNSFSNGKWYDVLYYVRQIFNLFRNLNVLLFSINQFIFELLSDFVNNIIEVLKFLYNYLF